MSLHIDMTESQLRLGIVKLALTLVLLLALIAIGLTLLARSGQDLGLSLLLVTMAFYFVASGAVAVTRVVDWFEARRSRRG